MDIATLKFKTIQEINGIQHMSKKQVDDLKYGMCYKFKLEWSDEHFNAVEEAVKLYFDMQNKVGMTD